MKYMGEIGERLYIEVSVVIKDDSEQFIVNTKV